jgi:hypothetical protein
VLAPTCRVRTTLGIFRLRENGPQPRPRRQHTSGKPNHWRFGDAAQTPQALRRDSFDLAHLLARGVLEQLAALAR